ncbi:hypothetical protein PENSPDRAFT_625667 [Peniophora sp. CONT]|nr:hypothetical protein PENSPDRAFT_625667 [Peniophora sp. CONT]
MALASARSSSFVTQMPSATPTGLFSPPPFPPFSNGPHRSQARFSPRPSRPISPMSSRPTSNMTFPFLPATQPGFSGLSEASSAITARRTGIPSFLSLTTSLPKSSPTSRKALATMPSTPLAVLRTADFCAAASLPSKRVPSSTLPSTCRALLSSSSRAQTARTMAYASPLQHPRPTHFAKVLPLPLLVHQGLLPTQLPLSSVCSQHGVIEMSSTRFSKKSPERCLLATPSSAKYELRSSAPVFHPQGMRDIVSGAGQPRWLLHLESQVTRFRSSVAG